MDVSFHYRTFTIGLLLSDRSVQLLLELVHDHPTWPISELVARHPFNQTGKQQFSYSDAQHILKRLRLSTALQRHTAHRLTMQNSTTNSYLPKSIPPEVLTFIRSRCQQQTELVSRTQFTPQQKLQFLQRVRKKRGSVTKVCQEAHLSRKRWYKWLKRYKQAGSDPKAFLGYRYVSCHQPQSN